MRGIILVSHGIYARELKNSVKMIAGDVTNVFEACLFPDEGVEQFKAKLEDLKKDVEKYDEVIVFADLMGGTPCNVALSVFMSDQRTTVIAGMNFPMVLTALLSDEMAVDELISEGKNSIVNAKAIIKSVTIDDEE